MPPITGRSGFDKLARVYRWMEYATFGPLLQRSRLQYLPALRLARQALVLGDGDGRFTVELLKEVPSARVVALDSSGAMLRALQQRAGEAGVADRLRIIHGDACSALPPGPFDCICAHFFLDCLSDADVTHLVQRVRGQCPAAMWVVSEFAVPQHRAARWPAAALVRLLYFAFRLLTGLRTSRLPDHAAAFQSAGLQLAAGHARAGGLLQSQLWRPGATAHLTAQRVSPMSRFNSEQSPEGLPDEEIPSSMPVDYPPADEDTVVPWLPADPLPSPEPEGGGTALPEFGV